MSRAKKKNKTRTGRRKRDGYGMRCPSDHRPDSSGGSGRPQIIESPLFVAARSDDLLMPTGSGAKQTAP